MQYADISLTDEQREELVRVLGKTKPTFYLREHDGINDEDILITLSYEDGSISTYSLWSFRSILYAGDAEDLTMASMHGSFMHFCGSTDVELVDFINHLTSGKH